MVESSVAIKGVWMFLLLECNLAINRKQIFINELTLIKLVNFKFTTKLIYISAYLYLVLTTDISGNLNVSLKAKQS